MNTASPPAPPEYDSQYWAQRFATEPWVRENDRFEDFEPAYRLGYSLRGRIADFHDSETECEQAWNELKESGAVAWDRVRPAVRAAWYRARFFTGRATLKDVLRRGEDRMCAAWNECEEQVRRHPSGSVLGAAATGYLCHLLPLRSILMTGIRIVTAAAPSALLLLGMWKVADFALRKSGDGPSTPSDPAAPAGDARQTRTPSSPS